ncbi:MAG: cytosine deaminase, partial [Okeania sp. SIO2D1]|nr:cytosine deaminase [Okeania sp. SIO2D1]
MFPTTQEYWLKNAHVPASLIITHQAFRANAEGLCLVNLAIKQGAIAAIIPASQLPENEPCYDLRQGMVLPCFVDMHTHLDKGHVWPRTSNPDGTFSGAVEAASADGQQYWHSE